MRTIIITSTFLLSSLASACNGPREPGSNPNCMGGNYPECVRLRNVLCIGTCWNQPAGECSSSCVLQSQLDCSGYCAGIYSCEDCIKALQMQSPDLPEESARDACSQPGDSYYCNCG
ncbi:hypothetical protein TWF594_004680 [Orbilia oligospora]|nr:hypothetical protein TWF706_010191 [Orbilia oligospora]KAF3144519.1 hypothetical protein TWF594_004680 [Orbilia oligospora]